MARLKCTGENARGEACGAWPLKGSTRCAAHPIEPDSARFGSPAQAREAAKLAGRPPLPKPTEVARRLVEQHVAAILRPHFKALGLMLNDDGTVTPLERGAILTGESKSGKVVASTIEDLGAQIAAAEKLLDRVYGRPKQSTELTGAGGGPMEIVPVSRERGADVVRLLAATGMVGAAEPAAA